MTAYERQRRLNEIVDELNDLQSDTEDLPLFGATDVDMALDFLRDTVDGFQEPSDAELDSIRSTCDKNLKWLDDKENKRIDLFAEYRALSDGASPFYHEATNRYRINWRS